MQTNTHIGRLVREPKVTVKGDKDTTIAYFKLAINDLPKGKATFIDYVAFNKTAELVEMYLKEKGQIVEVQFDMRNRNYFDTKTNEKVYTVQNVVTQFKNYTSQTGTTTNDDMTLEKGTEYSEITSLASGFNPSDYGFSEDYS